MLTAICAKCYFEMMREIKEFTDLWRRQCGTVEPYKIGNFFTIFRYLLNHKAWNISDKTHFQKFDYNVMYLNSYLKSL